jgi:tRNA(fMet)-specific endonuclease VapC
VAFNAHVGEIAMSSVTLMELVYGAENSNNPSKNLSVMEGLTARLEVLDYDGPAAYHTGEIRAGFKKVGRPIGPYDQMIAGHARSQGLIVVTNNVREFERVPGIRVENWVDT